MMKSGSTGDVDCCIDFNDCHFYSIWRFVDDVEKKSLSFCDEICSRDEGAFLRT